VTLAFGVLAALASALLYGGGVALQAIEARKMPESDSLRPLLLRHLATRRRWIIGTACVLAAWVMQALALLLAPLTVVQPALAVSIVALLFIGFRWFGQTVRRREVLAALAIAIGVGGLVATSPGYSDAHGEPLVLTIGLTALGIAALIPFALRRRHPGGGLVALSAGLAYAWTALATKFAADGLSSGAVGVALLWVAATAVAALAGLLSEMTALQRRSAIRVFPVVLVVQILVAVLLAPLLAGEGWSPDPLVVAGLGLSLAVVAAGTRALAGATAVEAAIASENGAATPTAATTEEAPEPAEGRDRQGADHRHREDGDEEEREAGRERRGGRGGDQEPRGGKRKTDERVRIVLGGGEAGQPPRGGQHEQQTRP